MEQYKLRQPFSKDVHKSCKVICRKMYFHKKEDVLYIFHKYPEIPRNIHVFYFAALWSPRDHVFIKISKQKGNPAGLGGRTPKK